MTAVCALKLTFLILYIRAGAPGFENFTGAIHATGAGATDHENPLRWRGVGVGCYGREGATPEG